VQTSLRMFRLEKKPRLGAPATPVTALSHVTGPAAVHTFFVRVLFATSARDVLGMPDTGPTTKEVVWFFFTTSWMVIHNYAPKANLDWIFQHNLSGYARVAQERLFSAHDAMCAELSPVFM
jgi:hypothetical protein